MVVLGSVKVASPGVCCPGAPVSTVTVVLESLELSPATMIRPITRPITKASSRPMTHRVRVSTAAMLAEHRAEYRERRPAA